jgi:hypothetical protein
MVHGGSGLLCYHNHKRGCRIGYSVIFSGIGEFLIVLIRNWQELDSGQQKTHLAVTLALGEISIVESCVGRWNELTAVAETRE